MRCVRMGVVVGQISMRCLLYRVVGCWDGSRYMIKHASSSSVLLITTGFAAICRISKHSRIYKVEKPLFDPSIFV